MNHFTKKEFDCKCGCGQNRMSQEFLERIDDARSMAGVPFVVNSGFRCERHNSEVGGSPTSSHKEGLAADIAARDSRARFHILRGAYLAGFKRIGIYETFLHLDGNEEKDQEVAFLKTKQGEKE